MEIGKTVTHYRILERLGGGGTGVVYRAEDTKLKRSVALKFLLPQWTNDQEAKLRFSQEAQAASALDHPNIATIFEIDAVDDQLFIAMAYYEGETLQAKLARGPLQLQESIHIAVEVAKGLARAHHQNIVHRDIKPANVIITNSGGIKILDFGLAKLIAATGSTAITQAGLIMGTIAYMSPEQARAITVDRRTDIWSLGVVIYEMVTGQLPFTGDRGQAVLYAILNEDPRPFGSNDAAPAPLQDIIFRALQKDPSHRYQYMDELLNDLQRLQTAGTDATVRIGAGESADHYRWKDFVESARNRKVIRSVLLYAVCAALLLGAIKVIAARLFSDPWFFPIAVVAVLAGVCGGTVLSFFRGPRHSRASIITKWGLLSAIFIVACIVSFGILRTNPLPTVRPAATLSAEPTSIAVIYFDNNTGDTELDWLRGGIPDILITALAQSKYLRVITPERLLDILKSMGEDVSRGLDRKTAIAAARRANAQVMITGSAIKAGTQFRILAQAYDSNGSLIETEQIEGGVSDNLITLVDELSSKVRVDLEVKANGVSGVAEGISKTRTTSVEAYKYYISGREELHKRYYEEAISDLRKAIHFDPAFAVVYELLANAYYILGEQSLAEETSQKAVQLSAKLPRTEQLKILRRNAQVKGDLNSEFEFLKQLEALQPDDAEWHFLLGWHYSTHKRAYEQSLFQFKKAIAIDPVGEPRYYEYLASVYLNTENRSDAIAACRKYVSLLPNDASSHTRLGEVYLLTGGYETALQEFKKADELKPDFFDTLCGLGNLYAAKGMCQEALKYGRRAVAQAISKNQERDGHLLLAIASLQNDDLRRALQEAQNALNLDPSNLKPHWIFGLIAVRKRELNSAESTAERMHDLLRKSHSGYQEEFLHDLKARISLARESFDAAIGEMQRANAFGPEDHAYFRDGLAEAYFRRGDSADAIQEFTKVFQFNPSYARSHYMLARVYEQRGKEKEALAEYETVSKILKDADPAFPLFRNLKERINTMRGRL